MLPDRRLAALRLFAAAGKIYSYKSGKYAYPRLIVYTADTTELDLLQQEFGGTKTSRGDGFTWQITSRAACGVMLEQLLDSKLLTDKKNCLAMLAYMLTEPLNSELQVAIFKEMKRVAYFEKISPELSPAFLSQLARGESSSEPLQPYSAATNQLTPEQQSDWTLIGQSVELRQDVLVIVLNATQATSQQ